MAKKLSYKELLSNLKGVTVRNVVPAELGWVVEAEGSSRAERSALIVELLPIPGIVATGVSFETSRCREHRLRSRSSWVVGVAEVASAYVRFSPSASTASLLPHSQQTNRLSEVHRLVGRALGGRSGQRLLKRLGMPSSRHTLLRQVIKAASGSVWQPAIRVVGVDDWAWRKGQSFVPSWSIWSAVR